MVDPRTAQRTVAITLRSIPSERRSPVLRFGLPITRRSLASRSTLALGEDIEPLKTTKFADRQPHERGLFEDQVLGATCYHGRSMSARVHVNHSIGYHS